MAKAPVENTPDPNMTIDEAFLAAQMEFEPIHHDGNNDHLNRTFATLLSVQKSVYPALHKYGFAVMQAVVLDGNQNPLGIETKLQRGTESISTIVPCNKWPDNPQHMGALISYLRRYGLLMLCGVAPNDASEDDGQSLANASREPAKKKQEPEKPAKPTVKQIMADIMGAQDEARLAQIEAYVEANANTSKAQLMKTIAEKRAQWTAPEDEGEADPYG